MSKNSNKIYCPQCGSEDLIAQKQGFFSVRKCYICKKCDYKGSLPLNTSAKIFYWTVTIIVAYILIIIAEGGRGRIGILGIIAPIILYQEWKNNKKLRQYWEDKKTSPIPLPKENYGVLKGIIYSVLILFLTFIIGGFALSNQSNVTNNATANTWQTFNSVDEGFKIDFPSYPKKEEAPSMVVNGITANYTTYTSSESNNDVYMIVVSKYDINPSNYNSKNGLEGMVNGFVNNIKGATLTSSSYSTFGNYQVLDFTANIPSQNMTFTGKAIIRDDLPTIKSFLIIAGSANNFSTKYDQFVSSFSFTQ